MILYPQEMKELIEALLLCSSEPLTLGALAEITGYESGDVLQVLDRLQQDYHEQGRGFEIREIAGGWMFATHPKHAPYIEKLLRPRITSLSQASLEVLSIIAYRQPVTRGEMEEIRGVNCDSSVNTLLERGLITEAGRKEVPGRPIMFATTTDFLKHFGLMSLRDLPGLPDLAELGEEAGLDGATERGEEGRAEEAALGGEAGQAEGAGSGGEAEQAGFFGPDDMNGWSGPGEMDELEAEAEVEAEVEAEIEDEVEADAETEAEAEDEAETEAEAKADADAEAEADGAPRVDSIAGVKAGVGEVGHVG